MKREKTVFIFLLALSTTVFTACQSAGLEEAATTLSVVAETVTEVPVEPEVSSKESNLVIKGDFRDKISDRGRSEEVIIESRDFSGRSTEGGTITRYMDADGERYRYTITVYGEMGRSETMYYIVDDVIYYSELYEDYNIPMYMENSHVMYRSLDQGMLADGICYQYDDLKEEFIYLEGAQKSCYTPAELDGMFNQAEPGESDPFN